MAIAGDDFGEGHWEGPCEFRFECGLACRVKFQGLAGLFLADGELREEDFAGGDEECAGSEGMEDECPAIFVSGDFGEAEVVDVDVCVELCGVVDFEDIDFAEDVFSGIPVGGVVEEIEDAPAEAWFGEVCGHGFPCAAEVAIGFEEGFVAVAVGVAG